MPEDQTSEEPTRNGPNMPDGMYFMPVPPGGLPDVLKQMFGIGGPALSCKERGHHCGHFRDGDDGTTSCCMCGVVKGFEDRPPLGACDILTKRIAHHSHIEPFKDEPSERYECPGYNPPPDLTRPGTPPYVDVLLQSLLTGQPLDFNGLAIPEDLKYTLEREVAAGRLKVKETD